GLLVVTAPGLRSALAFVGGWCYKGFWGERPESGGIWDMTLSTYVLAVDIGTSRTAAATARLEADGSIRTTPITLGRRGDSVGSAVFVCDDGELLFGDAAERRGITQPERLIREFKRGVGDEVPHSVGGRRLTSAELYAQTVASVVDAATEREGRT